MYQRDDWISFETLVERLTGLEGERVKLSAAPLGQPAAELLTLPEAKLRGVKEFDQDQELALPGVEAEIHSMRGERIGTLLIYRDYTVEIEHYDGRILVIDTDQIRIWIVDIDY